jgi:superoxide dismutase, Cu-Zn family
MSTKYLWLSAVLISTGILACRSGGTTSTSDTKTAVAKLQDQNGVELGQVKISEKQPGVVRLEIEVDAKNSQMALGGDHAVHIHEGGTCAGPDFTSAGDHFNPTNTKHGSPEWQGHHAGDLGNVEIEEDRTGKKSLNTIELTLTPNQPSTVVGRTVIIHEKQDDFVTQDPPGNAGGRIACGVITMEPAG